MKIARHKSELDQFLFDNTNKKIGFVPTMGALHKGHLSLIDIAQKHSDVVVVSIFVNPTQFTPDEDFGTYPRTEDSDIKKLEEQGACDLVFIPTPEILYPDGTNSHVSVGKAAMGLESTYRPSFFNGVVNVVDRLFKLVKPNYAVFGEKDYQQLQVIREMVDDYNMDINIIGGATVRDDYGLALSSRNKYLSQSDIKIAQQFNIILKNALQTGDMDTAKFNLQDIGFDKIDYIEERWGRVLGAAWIGKTRLIDNV